MKEFGFLNVNSAIAGAMTAIPNQATSFQPSGMSFTIVIELIKASAKQTKMEIKKDLEVMHTEVNADAHTYVDIIVDDLKLTLDASSKLFWTLWKAQEAYSWQAFHPAKLYL